MTHKEKSWCTAASLCVITIVLQQRIRRMTIDELRERIKNQIVLHDGELADWQWPATGLPTEAAELGITDFRRLVNDVSRQLNSYFGRILDLKEKVIAQARKQQKKLSNGDIDDIVNEAERLTLARGFVADQWIPAILKSIPDTSSGNPAPSLSVPPQTTYLSPTPSPLSAQATGPVASSAPGPVSSPEATPGASTDIDQKVKDILDDYDRHIPIQALRTLFRAIGGDENTLAEAVQGYLSANFFSAETEPKGQTLKEKLLSTAWRHLSWWEDKATPPAPSANSPVVTTSQPESVKATQAALGHPMVDSNYQPPPQAPQSGSPPNQPRTNLSGLWGALFAVAFLLIIYWFVKGGNKNPTAESKERLRTEQTEAPVKSRKTRKKRSKAANAPGTSEQRKEGQRTAGAKTAPAKPEYEELLDDVGQYSEQPARKNGRWGLWRNEKWFIKPIYDEVTVFQDGRATVTLGNVTFEIDRFGNKVSSK